MPKATQLTDLSVSDIAELLGVTARQVRNWIGEKGLPARDGNRGRILDWHKTLSWFIEYRIEESGSGGNGRASKGSNLPEIPLESYEQALARKTRAEADLKELQLARERGEVAAISDVEKAISSANASTKTLIQAFPSRLSTQLLGLDDRQKIHALLQRECNALLGNLASIDAVMQSRSADEDGEE